MPAHLLRFHDIGDGVRLAMDAHRVTTQAHMTCRIDRLSNDHGIVLRISGRITGEDLEVLRRALSEGRIVAVELAEVALVDRDAVRFLAVVEAQGIELRQGAAYIGEWILRERDRF